MAINRKQQILIGVTLAITIGIIVVAAASDLPLGKASSTTSSSSSSTTNTVTTTLPSQSDDNYSTIAETNDTALGLEFLTYVNSTTLLSGQGINVTTSVENMLPTVNNVSAAWDWAIPSLQNFSYSGLPCPRYETFRVFNGYYSETNISAATPLFLYPVSQEGYPLICPDMNFSSFLFKPSSSIVNVSSTASINMAENGPLNGYYTANETRAISPPDIPVIPFAPGVYTIAAGDEWGQMVILHFKVISNSITTTTTCLQPTGSPVGCATETTTSSPTSSTITTCSISAEPTGFFLHVITDGTPRPIEGAILNATTVSDCGTYTSSQILTTNSSGWASIPLPEISGNYFMVFQVQYTNSSTGETSSNFISQVNWEPQEGTFVTLSLPSGTVSFSYLLPASCNGVCYYRNIPQFITIVQPEGPSRPAYTIQLWTNNTLEAPTITNVTLLTTTSNQTQVLEFYVPYASYVFAGPSSFPATNTNGSIFYMVSYPGGTIVPTAYYKADNLLYSTEQVQGWMEIYSSPP